MVRIRYNVNSSTGELISKPIDSTLGVLRTHISRTEAGWRAVVEKIFYIDNTVAEWTELNETAAITKNLAVAKSKAKRALKDLGVNFMEEVRRRGGSE